MINPSEVDISRRFVGSRFGKREKEMVARNIVVLSQALAFAHNDDTWIPFTQEDYAELRAATSDVPIHWQETEAMTQLTESGYLDQDELGSITVTDQFLDVVVDFVKPTAEQPT
jgi:hypothetical protein